MKRILDLEAKDRLDGRLDSSPPSREEEPRVPPHQDNGVGADYDARDGERLHFAVKEQGQRYLPIRIGIRNKPIEILKFLLAFFVNSNSNYLNPLYRSNSNLTCAARIAIQSFCAPQCEFSDTEWDMLSIITSLRSMLRSSNAVSILTFPPSIISPTFSKRLQHLADILLSVKAIPDEDKELAKLLTCYNDMVGLS